ncbi:MAG: protein kinase domain-containing protein [Isosphaeraceae bacterium]
MSVSSSGRRTWEEASSPTAVRLAREYEQAWRDSDRRPHRPDPKDFLEAAGTTVDGPGARLALLRADLTLRWESGEKVGAQWYLDRYTDLGEDTIVALIYEEFCLREEDEEGPEPEEFLSRFSRFAGPLRRVLDIHQLVGSGSTATGLLAEAGSIGGAAGAFPEAGETIAGFHLVEELGRGAFARVFLARERQLADRPVALKVSRRGSREPQTLARLQHTHIVPVHSHRIDRATGLHLLCMPYFGRTTLAQVLANCLGQDDRSGYALVEALDRLEPDDDVPAGPSAGRAALAQRSYEQAIAWWGARLAEALGHAHDRDVLHRDIKPSNVLVTSDGMPMLLDFNLAREPVAEDGSTGDADSLGGTVDYMAPEHLRALAQGGPEAVDGRSDIYSLGVVLFEALTGQRPFDSPRRGSSIVEALLRAADERQRSAPRPRAIDPAIPPALDAVVRRCLEPDPDDRYDFAAELAADLHSVANDLPLPYTREPWPSRIGGWIRRRSRRLAMGFAVVLALFVACGLALVVPINRAENRKLVQKEYDKGMEEFGNGNYESATRQFDATIDLIEHFDKTDPRKYPSKWRSLPTTMKSLGDKLREFHVGPNLDEMLVQARYKQYLAGRFAQTQNNADRLFETAERLRFRLLLSGNRDLQEIRQEIFASFEPFLVLTSPDWTKNQSILEPLDTRCLDRLRTEVNELLFFWIARVDQSISLHQGLGPKPLSAKEKEGIETLIKICDRALGFAEPKEPWRALRNCLAPDPADERRLSSRSSIRGGPLFDGEPEHMREERSALASFQWALLCLRADRKTRAIQWMRHAVRIEQDNYWYQYFLAYIEDQADLIDDALNHYSVAVALKPKSPWVRFSRARLYRSKGLWSQAIEDMNTAVDELRDRPEGRQVHLELGYVHQELGDFARARAEYEEVIRSNDADSYARAARLNRANLDAESGHVDRARKEYDALMSLDLGDAAARQSRAILELRMGQSDLAEKDLNSLLEMGFPLKHPGEILAARALARLLGGRPAEALEDASEARRAYPSPAHERIWQRALLAARRFDSLQFDRPESLWLLPVGGDRLEADLRLAANGLARLAAGRDEMAYRATLTRAVILAALGEADKAFIAASRALALSPFSPYAYLIRARILDFSGNRQAAFADVERGLAIRLDEPGLIELHGSLLQASGDPRGAIQDYNRAIARGELDGIHVRKASALVAVGQYNEAIVEWSLALRRDPELPEAFLGRARTHILLDHPELALADLEQAASWAHSDPRIEIAIVAAYLRCLAARPDRLPRILDLTRRAAYDVWRSIDVHSRRANPH